jgi:hypothetical protein
LQRAENIWILAFQEKYFPTKLDYLKSQKKAWRPALVSQLDLFLDTERIIRCKGRLQNATMTESAKHTVLIPKYFSLALLIITKIHKQVFHYGTETTLAKLIQRYWIPSARPRLKESATTVLSAEDTMDQNTSILIQRLIRWIASASPTPSKLPE